MTICICAYLFGDIEFKPPFPKPTVKPAACCGYADTADRRDPQETERRGTIVLRFCRGPIERTDRKTPVTEDEEVVKID